ncbi:MAG TPA: hypothetical protein PK079_21430 [Leptospiraceae bacterium]|nr:hypothetical protein [Leptospiraceae bacterium]HMW03659.1 hypothetical protein [Leptospiraceae bacterium]HMX31214.1 hypothetical protein [Leptospiraceae bacterium]HMY29420.1 hypothetical protein [Leptospiraceae bacterium]HMZ65830.1 hypothetical protein [Leptospiraceae bacterium]
MNLPKDILDFIEKKFLDTDTILDHLERLNQYLDEMDVKESRDRIIRSILFLTAANEDLFRQYLEMTKLDYRDILYLAEYENDKQVRNFLNPISD